MHIEYLLFNLVVLALPLFSYLIILKAPQLNFSLFFKSVTISSLPFIAYDISVTGTFWSFNPAYIMGVQLLKVPIEEVLFFFTVPLASLFLWHFYTEKNLNKHEKTSRFIYFLMIIGCIFIAAFFVFQYYTSSICLFLAVVLAIDSRRTQPLLVKSNMPYFAIIILLTMIFNNYLTGRPIVIYNSHYISNIKIITMPIEDLFFSLAMISTTIFTFEYLKLRHF